MDVLVFIFLLKRQKSWLCYNKTSDTWQCNTALLVPVLSYYSESTAECFCLLILLPDRYIFSVTKTVHLT